MDNQYYMEYEIYQKFLLNNSEYITQKEKLISFINDLHLHWQKVELLRFEMCLDTYNEVYSSTDSQWKLIDLFELPPYTFDENDLILKYFDQASIPIFTLLVQEFFEIWNKKERIEWSLTDDDDSEQESDDDNDREKNEE